VTRVKFWGVRGSIPAPLTGRAVEDKIRDALASYEMHCIYEARNHHNPHPGAKEFLKNMPFSERATYGGNTSCVEVLCGEEQIVLDMGTGLRLLGNNLFGKMKQKKGLKIHFFISHVHWDHIQGLPFFGPLYVNKEDGIKNWWNFYGGTSWMATAETCLKGQMDQPVFPVSFKEIEAMTYRIDTNSLYDKMNFSIGSVQVKTRKLNHPQETFGWRIEHNGKIIVYTTDNEPYDPNYPDPRLLELADGADVWITDCQYTKAVYEGEVGGVHRHGWGHSYPEAVARTAVLAGVKKTVLFHHDPSSTDKQIDDIAAHCKSLVEKDQDVVAAYEELEIALD